MACAAIPLLLVGGIRTEDAGGNQALADFIEATRLLGATIFRSRAIRLGSICTVARAGAVLAMNVSDYFMKGKRSWIRLHEKGNKYHEMPLHHKAEEYLDAYIQAAGIAGLKQEPLLRSLNRQRKLSDSRFERRDCWKMVKRRARRAGLPEGICNHTFRGTGITVFLENGGSLEDAQRMANHASAETTKLYDRRNDYVSVEMVELVMNPDIPKGSQMSPGL